MCKNEIAIKQQTNYLAELKNTQELCSLLMKTPHYAKMGIEGIFAIVETAKSLGVDPRLALGGGLYFVRGKVEMSARLMNALIRSKKHSITRDRRSDNTICILHGKRSDNGDQWSESFSVEEAKKAGLFRPNTPWINFTRDMLFARALSRLARQLFPDIIGNCYVEGEISLDPNIKGFSYQNEQEDEPVKEVEKLTKEEVLELTSYLNKVPEYKNTIEEFLTRKGIENLVDMPKEMYIKVLSNAKDKFDAQIDLESMKSEQKEIDEEVENESL